MPFYKVPATSSSDIQRGSHATTASLATGGVDTEKDGRVVDMEKDGSEKSSTFAELTEADRDAEVMRRTLEQEVERSQGGGASHDLTLVMFVKVSMYIVHLYVHCICPLSHEATLPRIAVLTRMSA